MYAWKEKHPARTITVNGLWEPPPTAFADNHAYAEKTKKKRNIQVAKVITWAAPAEVIEVPDVSDDPATEKQEEVQQEEVQQQGSEEQQEEVQEEQEERPLKKSDLMYAVQFPNHRTMKLIMRTILPLSPRNMSAPKPHSRNRANFLLMKRKPPERRLGKPRRSEGECPRRTLRASMAIRYPGDSTGQLSPEMKAT